MRKQMRTGFYLLASILFLTAMAGCGSGEQPVATSTTYRGTVAGNGGQTGTISITVQTTNVVHRSSFSVIRSAEAQTSDVPATGTCVLANGGGTVQLTQGTYNTGTGNFTVSSADGTTVFTGTTSNGSMSGTFTGPNGLSGGFDGLDTSLGNVTVYCGTYTGNPDVGVFNISVSSDGSLSGTAQPTNGQGKSVTLSGTVSGGSFTGTTSDNASFQGTISGSSINGTFPINGGGTGTFSGSTGGC